MEYDVIIPVGEKDVAFLPRVVDHLTRCFDNMDAVYILTAHRYFDKITKRIGKYKNYVLIDENELVPGLSFSELKRKLKELCPEKNIPVGWYLQQFLKFGFARSKFCKDYYLSWDADTLALAPIDFFEQDHILFNPKHEYNPNYFKTIERLFGYGKLTDFSYIAENMMFSKKIVCEMLDVIEQNEVKGDTWMDKILNACDLDDPMPAFSEFETYGTYCYVNYPELYQKRYLNTFREAGFICGRNISERKLRVMSFDLDTASFELNDEPMFPYNIPSVYSKYKMKFKKFLSAPFNENIVRVKQIIYGGNKRMAEVPDDILYRLPPKLGGENID